MNKLEFAVFNLYLGTLNKMEFPKILKSRFKLVFSNMKNSIVVFLLFLLVSCNAYKDIPVQELSVGMTVQQVQTIVKKELVQASLSTENGVEKKVYQVQKRIVRGGVARQQRYNIYFIDGKMVKYEKESEKFSF